MLEGEIVELDRAENFLRGARHPYTRTLLGSFPSLSGARGGFIRSGVDETAQPDATEERA
jgi:peptide/nickel transport system ATP-binding protein